MGSPSSIVQVAIGEERVRFDKLSTEDQLYLLRKLVKCLSRDFRDYELFTPLGESSYSITRVGTA
jgi:hypothetical protein